MCQSLKGKKLADGKGVSGKGRLTDKAVTTLQNYYGMAIRQNMGDLQGMRKVVGAVPYHCSELKMKKLATSFVLHERQAGANGNQTRSLEKGNINR